MGAMKMTSNECKICRDALPDLLLGSSDGASSQVAPDMAAHLAACPECRQELNELRATWAMMDDWQAPEPSAYFDSRLHARLREAQAAAPESLWSRLSDFLRFSTGRGLRPALAGALVFALLLGGGTVAGVIGHQWASKPMVSSPVVNDLKIYDNNAQALQQMDILDETGADGDSAQPQS